MRTQSEQSWSRMGWLGSLPVTLWHVVYVAFSGSRSQRAGSVSGELAGAEAGGADCALGAGTGAGAGAGH